MQKFGLAQLISPHSKEEFLSGSWPRLPFAVHGLQSEIQPLRDLPFLQSLEALLNSWPFPVQVHLPDAADESSSIDATAADARKLFSNHMPLLFNNVQRISPFLSECLMSLKQDLGLPTSTYARCLVYATPDGKGTATHFDQNVNFVLQLHGTKKWWLAPNHHIENPTQRFTIGQPMDPELAFYAENEMPSEMPKEKEQFVLKPGSMLFVPRGYWHSTEAESEALALNFTFSQPTWVDLFTTALRSRLNLSPQWRELADGVTSSDPNRRAEAEQEFDGLLAGLIEDLPNWNAAGILSATEGDLF